MSPEFYRILHLGAIFFVFAALGGMVLAHRDGNVSPAARKLASMTHGIALLVVLVAGFGLFKYVGVAHNPATWPLWVWGKFATWLLLGAALVLIRKRPQMSTLWWVGLPLLGMVNAYLAFFKPT
jgi:hypothetical protein